MQGQPEADRRRPGPAQGQALGGHGQGQDVGRRISCRGRQERGVEGSPRVSVGLREEFCTALRISTDRSVGQFHPLHSKCWFCKISTELPICWNPRTGLFNAKRRPNWTVMLSTMLNLSVDSRKLLMSGQGLSMKEGIASQKSILVFYAMRLNTWIRIGPTLVLKCSSYWNCDVGQRIKLDEISSLIWIVLYRAAQIYGMRG